MSTYNELASEVLGKLDQSLSTTGDVLTQVQTEIQRTNEKLCVDLRPKELLVSVGPVNISSITTSIPLNLGGFGVSNMDLPFQLRVDYKTQTTVEDLEWEFKEWETWLQLKNSLEGNARPTRVWTIDPSNNIFLSLYPTSPDTWDTYLHYYKATAVFSGSAEPELPKMHHWLISVGASLSFPQYFQGDRATLLAKYQNDFNEGRAKLMKRKRGIAGKVGSLGIRDATKVSNKINWGD